MKKKLLATVALLGLMAMPALASTQVLKYPTRNGKTVVITITFTDLNGNGRIDSIPELRSITNIQVTVQ